jgi:predicted short-subunit dehydrogenase-like oxidoreductase (DUF2520 family)
MRIIFIMWTIFCHLFVVKNQRVLFLYYLFKLTLMKISIVGSGNVATVLARLAVQKGHTIHQIISRNIEDRKILAKEVDATYIFAKDQVDTNIDLAIVAIADNALPEGIADLQFGDVPVVHTAGAVSMHELAKNSSNVGVLYPLQSLRKEMETIPPIPFLIEANNDGTLYIVQTFALSLSDNVKIETEEKRFRLHTAAVIVSNFTNYLYGVAETFCKEESIDFNLLKPLIKETATRIEHNSPIDVQTGPAKRGDIITLSKHLRLLEAHPKLRVLYTRMTDGIMNG